MKLTNLLSPLIALVGSLFFIQCSNDEGLFSSFELEEPPYTSVEEVQDSLVTPTIYTFEYPDNDTDTTFITPRGIRLHFPQNSISVGDSTTVGTHLPPYSVKIIEIFTRGDLIRQHIQTYQSSNNGIMPIVSGGMFWLEVTNANGIPVNLHGVEAYIPFQTDADGYEDLMDYFMGTISIPDTYIKSLYPGQADLYYDPVPVPNGEFVIYNVKNGYNAGGAYLENELPTQFYLKINGVSSFDNLRAYVTFDDYTTVGGISLVDGDRLKVFNGMIPQGTTGKIIVYGVENGELLLGNQNIVVLGDDEFEMTLTPGTIEELSELLNSLD